MSHSVATLENSLEVPQSINQSHHVTEERKKEGSKTVPLCILVYTAVKRKPQANKTQVRKPPKTNK
jgi:hypothetical protein